MAIKAQGTFHGRRCSNTEPIGARGTKQEELYGYIGRGKRGGRKGREREGGGEREMAKRGLEGDFHVGSAKYYARVAALLTGTKI